MSDGVEHCINGDCLFTELSISDLRIIKRDVHLTQSAITAH